MILIILIHYSSTHVIVQLMFSQLKLEALKLEDVNNVISKQEQRIMVRDMVGQVIQENTTPDPKDAEDNDDAPAINTEITKMSPSTTAPTVS